MTAPTADERAELEARARAAEAMHRDLVSRLGFGDNITEPMADNDTIVAWFEQQSRDANEWQESQLWRNDCYLAGHPDDEDCRECDPTLRLARAEAKVAAVEALAEEWDERRRPGMVGIAKAIRAALGVDASGGGGGRGLMGGETRAEGPWSARWVRGGVRGRSGRRGGLR